MGAVRQLGRANMFVQATGRPEQSTLGRSLFPSLLYPALLPGKGENNLAIGWKTEEHEATMEQLSSKSKPCVQHV